MERVYEIMQMMCRMPKRVEARGIELAKQLGVIRPFIQPLVEINQMHYSKSIWSSCADIVSSKSDAELKPDLPLLLEWLQDLNWPGALQIQARLWAYRDEASFREAYDESVRQAKASDDWPWLASLDEIARNAQETEETRAMDSAELLQLFDQDSSQYDEAYIVDLARKRDDVRPLLAYLSQRREKGGWGIATCALILSTRRDEALRPFLPELFELLRAFHQLAATHAYGAYFAALYLHTRLQGYADHDSFRAAYDACVKKAEEEEDEDWLDELDFLARDTPEIERITAKNALEILDMLDESMPAMVQARGIELAMGYGDVTPFLRPETQRHNRNVWENCALVVATKSDKALMPHLTKLLRWLPDVRNIKEIWSDGCKLNILALRLSYYEDCDSFDAAYAACMKEAETARDEDWLESLHDLRKGREHAKVFGKLPVVVTDDAPPAP